MSKDLSSKVEPLNTTNSSEAYFKSIHEIICFYKDSLDIRQAFLRSISLNEGCCLVPVGRFHLSDSRLIEKLTCWRNNHVEVFPSQFVATQESTKIWLEQHLINNKNRILFLVADRLGDVIGHLGLNNCLATNNILEIDNVIRGIPENSPGLFGNALIELISWSKKIFPLSAITLRVMADNAHAIAFYKRHNFVEVERIPLFCEENNQCKVFREAKKMEPVSNYFVRMSYSPPAFIGEELVLTAGPSVSAKEVVYVNDAAVNGWNSNWSLYINKFEVAFAEYVGVKYALATSSCTGALQIALMSLGVGPGDEVIVPDLTWVASANAITYVGAIPVFADIELDTWNISSESIESLISENTKAIVVVHMYGHPARMDQICALASKYNLKVVEDAAPAIGAEWNSMRCGSFGDFGAFSFQGAKLLVTGEGGMLVTNNKDLYLAAKKIWDQGRNPNKTFWIDGEGVKFKMSNLQAAFGLAQLERVDALIEMKRRIFSWYEDFLGDCTYIKLNKEVHGARSIYWMTSLILNSNSPLTRDELISQLREKNVDTRPVFPAISQYPIWPLQQSPKPNAKLVGDRAINLPSGVCLTKEKVEYVAKCIKDCFKMPIY